MKVPVPSPLYFSLLSVFNSPLTKHFSSTFHSVICNNSCIFLRKKELRLHLFVSLMACIVYHSVYFNIIGETGQGQKLSIVRGKLSALSAKSVDGFDTSPTSTFATLSTLVSMLTVRVRVDTSWSNQIFCIITKMYICLILFY